MLDTPAALTTRPIDARSVWVARQARDHSLHELGCARSARRRARGYTCRSSRPLRKASPGNRSCGACEVQGRRSQHHAQAPMMETGHGGLAPAPTPSIGPGGQCRHAKVQGRSELTADMARSSGKPRPVMSTFLRPFEIPACPSIDGYSRAPPQTHRRYWLRSPRVTKRAGSRNAFQLCPGNAIWAARRWDHTTTA